MIDLARAMSAPKILAEPGEVISLRQVWAGYDRNIVLEDINLSVKERDFVGIIGPNGGGKTTLLKILLGLLPPMRGEVRLLGQKPQIGRRKVGYVPQLMDCDRDFPIEVWDVVQMGRLGKNRLLKPYNVKDEEKVVEALRQVDLLDFRHRTIGDLSGGQRQRVYIARALACDPQILILDEPTASVDSSMQTSIFSLLEQLNAWMTILIISHDVGAIARHVKTVGCLNRHLHYHGEKLLTAEMLEATYHCPIDLIAHGIPHRVLAEHATEE
jgi:zinc transport system ATP-binding protein